MMQLKRRGFGPVKFATLDEKTNSPERAMSSEKPTENKRIF